MSDSVVIVGAGLAGYGVARQLRRRDKSLSVRIITADDGRYYYKPDLSEALSKGKTPAELASADATAMADQLNASIDTHTTVTAIDPDEHRVHTDKGSFDYERLVLALGAEPRQLPLGGDGADAVCSVNSLGDYEHFRERLEGAKRVVVLGAGLVGCEFANDLATAGYEVTVVFPEAAPLARFLPPTLSQALEQGLAEVGIHWRSGRTAQQVDRTDDDVSITLDEGSHLKADVVLSAVGLNPHLELARKAGLAVDRGIQVNRYLETSRPQIHAVGDCAEVEGYVLPFVFPLMQCARALGATLSGERTAVRYPAMPVTVKTHAYPVSTLPPPAHVAGEWTIEPTDGGYRALFHDAAGVLRGFALAGEEPVKETGRLARQIPDLLGER